MFKFEITNNNDGLFNRGDKIEIILDLGNYKYLKGEEIGIFIKNASGITLCYLTKQIQSSTMFLALDSSPLKEGVYSLDIFAHLPNQKITFSFDRRMVFNINLNTTDLVEMSNKKDHGVFYLEHNWIQ
jgi:hypothetical protein